MRVLGWRSGIRVGSGIKVRRRFGLSAPDPFVVSRLAGEHADRREQTGRGQVVAGRVGKMPRRPGGAAGEMSRRAW